jgi:hypothetical protein
VTALGLQTTREIFKCILDLVEDTILVIKNGYSLEPWLTEVPIFRIEMTLEKL